MNWMDMLIAWNTFMRNQHIGVKSARGISLDPQWCVICVVKREGGEESERGERGRGRECGCEGGRWGRYRRDDNVVI